MAIRIIIVSANQHKEPYPVYPLGTAYLNAYIHSLIDDCEIIILDMNLLSKEEVKKCIRTSNPDIICVSIRNVDGINSLNRKDFIPEYKELMSDIRVAIRTSCSSEFISIADNSSKQSQHSKSIPIIIGGAGFSIYPEIFMHELDADYGIQGEGEYIIVELIKAICYGAEVPENPRLYINTRLKKSTTNNSSKSTTILSSNIQIHEESIDDCKSNIVPCALKSKLNNNYIKSPCAVYNQNLVEYYWKQSGMLNIQTKRGCPYKCIYCTYPQIDGCTVRTVEIESIVDTIAKAKKDFGASYWFFTDSVFNLKKQFNIELAEAIIKQNLNISWGAYFSPSNMTDDELSIYKKAGLTHIEFGTESFCDETLQAYGKHFCFDDVVKYSELAFKHNIFYAHFLILAGWGETKNNLAKTITNSQQLKHTVIFPYVGMRIYPNTKLQEYAISEGVISKEDNLFHQSYYIAPDFDLEETKELALKTGKAWIFPDAPQDALVNTLKVKRNKKGPLWEYLRKP